MKRLMLLAVMLAVALASGVGVLDGLLDDATALPTGEAPMARSRSSSRAARTHCRPMTRRSARSGLPG